LPPLRRTFFHDTGRCIFTIHDRRLYLDNNQLRAQRARPVLNGITYRYNGVPRVQHNTLDGRYHSNLFEGGIPALQYPPRSGPYPNGTFPSGMHHTMFVNRRYAGIVGAPLNWYVLREITLLHYVNAAGAELRR